MVLLAFVTPRQFPARLPDLTCFLTPFPRPCPRGPRQYKYTPAWRGHVLSHLPFYLLLLPHFASLSLSRLTYRPDAALRDLDRVLAVLAAAGPELLRELRGAEEALREYARPAAAGGRRRSEGELGELLPWWLEQVGDEGAWAGAG